MWSYTAQALSEGCSRHRTLHRESFRWLLLIILARVKEACEWMYLEGQSHQLLTDPARPWANFRNRVAWNFITGRAGAHCRLA
ncbi:unnamed protein product [Calypogeia fissa]